MLVNQMLGDYQILELIGKGGQGEVYKALDTKLKRPVAIKIFTAEGNNRRQKLASFKYEAQLASSLDHPNLCTIYGFFEEQDYTFIVMEYVEGKNLFELASGRPLEIKSVLEIVLQVTAALCAAHERRIIHRDIKPRNVMVKNNGQVVVLDFGLAKLLGNEDENLTVDEPDEIHPLKNDDITESLFKTIDGTPYGSPTSSPPEMARGEPTDTRGDVYSVGVLLYLLLTGTYPFLATTIKAVRHKVINEEPVPVSVARKAEGVIPLELIAIVRRALRKDPAERFQTIEEMRERLLIAFGEIDKSENPVSALPATSELRFAAPLPKSLLLQRQPLFILSILASLTLTAVLLWCIFY